MTEDYYYLGYNGHIISANILSDDAEYDYMVEMIREGEEFVTLLSYSECDGELPDWAYNPRHVPAHRWSKIKSVLKGYTSPSGYTTEEPTSEKALKQFGLPIREDPTLCEHCRELVYKCSDCGRAASEKQGGICGICKDEKENE